MTRLAPKIKVVLTGVVVAPPQLGQNTSRPESKSSRYARMTANCR